MIQVTYTLLRELLKADRSRLVLIAPVQKHGGTNHDMNEVAPGKATTTPKNRPSLTVVGDDNEAPQRTPISKTIVPETRLTALLATVMKKATSATAINVPEDNPLHYQDLQLVHESESYSTQGCNIAGIYFGPLPRADV